MNVFSFIVALTALSMIYGLSSKWLEARRKHPADSKRIQTEFDELRERIETLERIVTDQRNTLRQKFDEL